MAQIVEVDQSGKIEDTSRDTVLALSNGITYTVLIPATVKRQCVKALRDSGLKGQTLYFQLFATTLYFLLKDYLFNLERVVIDNEYVGKEDQIKQHLYSLCQRAGMQIEVERVQFGFIGKRSPAHALALATLRKQNEANRTLTITELLKEFRLGKKAQRAESKRRGRERE